MLIVSFQPLPFYFKLSFLACFLGYGLLRVTAMKQSERWGGDMGEVQITYMPAGEGWLYLAGHNLTYGGRGGDRAKNMNAAQLFRESARSTPSFPPLPPSRWGKGFLHLDNTEMKRE